jgi:2Fe-2S ferredoxin
MTKITYIEDSGTEHLIEATPGQSVMEAAVKNGVPGIVAECGGSCACATCQVFVEPDWFATTGPAGPMEQSMLECVPETRPTSRLSCQIKISVELDGLIVRIPKSQY